MFKVIFSGLDESGKTTTAQALAKLASKQFNRDVKVYSLGYQLRLIAIELKLLTEAEAFEKPLKPEVRHILKAVGQTARYVEPRYWVSHLKFDDPDYWIIDDVRNFHDFEQLRYMGAYSVFLDMGSIDTTIASHEDLPHIRQHSRDTVDVYRMRSINITPEELAGAILISATNPRINQPYDPSFYELDLSI